MYRRLLELLKLIKPRQPHLPQTNVIRSVCGHEVRKREYYRDGCYKCWDCLKIVVEQTDV